jgi:ABC-type transport system substrate-binding protein
MWGKRKKEVEEITSVEGKPAEKQNYDKSTLEVAVLKHNQKCIVDKMGRKIEETGFAVENLINITNKVAESVEVQMDSINKVASQITNYSALAEEVFASTEDSKQIANQTMNAAHEGSRAVNDSIQAMQGIQSSVKYAKSTVNELSRKSEHINDMLNSIKDIAKHTNLLSLNASIEAARAGEAGRGFSVVAQEVKNLAQRSAESAEYISKVIGEINESINQTIAAMDSSELKVREGSDKANNTLSVFNKIIAAVTSSANVAQEINAAVSKQTESLETVITSTEDMNSISKNVLSMVETASLDSQYTKASLGKLSEVSKNLENISTKLLDRIQSVDKNETAVKLCLTAAPLDFDPAMAHDVDSGQILVNTHSGLLNLGASGEILPGIAKSWYMEEDNLTWIFNLRRGAKFQDGSEVTAEDVRYSYERLLNPETRSTNSWYLEQVEGSQDFISRKTREVKGIKVLDRYRISIRLSSAYSGFILNLAQFACSIISKAACEKEKIIGCGPFIIQEKREDGCTLCAFKDYYGGTPYVDKITIQYNENNAVEGFQGNKYDFVLVDSKSALEKLKEQSSKIKMRSLIGSYYVGFNLESKSELIQDVEIRKALNHAVNKKRIISDVLGGLAEESKGPIPPNMIENNYLAGFEYNQNTAREILRRKGALGQKLTIITREGSENTVFNRIAHFVIEDLKEIGINCVVQKVAMDKYLKPETIKNCDLFISRWIADTGDLDNYLQPIFNPAPVTNRTRYNNPEVTSLLNEAKAIINPQKRVEIYKNIQKAIVNDVPWIFLYHPQMGYVYRDGVFGSGVSPLGLVRYEDIIVEK